VAALTLPDADTFDWTVPRSTLTVLAVPVEADDVP
jgi:hypothetical protein